MSSARAQALVAAAGRVAVLTGAGISTDSGIPDFRGPDGVWTRDPKAERLTDIREYVRSKEVREQAWRTRAHHPAWAAEPNAGHRALVGFEATGKLTGLLTQNIDGLHELAGSNPDLVLELHGTMFRTVCLTCDATGDMRDALERVAAGETDPPCPACGGVLKSATISFGQALDAGVLARARRIAEECDLMLAVGSSLSVHPAAGLVGVAARNGATVIVCNGSETPYDLLAEVVVRDPISEVLPFVLGTE
ncbi:MAG TPA: Sir2 family NAD-dependent protein deacetylase [Pseudonocardiaceae bacterium]|jgi:NAD-dependent deacetylase|nr:Sir2 family NAD-dependent protein deacetylase [Pseudonocardiaceae bacterium]